MRPRTCGTLVLVRHGETTWDAECRFTGWADPHLSEAGKLQVDEAARALKESGYTFDVVYTSMLKRAVETTWLLLKELGLIYLPVWKHWQLNDRSYGALTGHTLDEFQEEYGAETVRSWRRSLDAQPPPFQPNHAFDPAATRRYAIWEDREGIREPAALQKRLDATTPQGAPVASLTGAKGSTPRLCTPACRLSAVIARRDRLRTSPRAVPNDAYPLPPKSPGCCRGSAQASR